LFYVIGKTFLPNYSGKDTNKWAKCKAKSVFFDLHRYAQGDLAVSA